METKISVIWSIFIGVVSGVATSIVIWVIVNLFKNTVLPWYQSIIYRGQKIDGDWEGYTLIPKKNESGVGQEKCSMMHLKQKGNSVTGVLTLIKQPSGMEENKEFNLKGFFNDNCLVLTYEVRDKTRFGQGAYVFRLVEDGQKLDGYQTAINTVSPNVFSITYFFNRKK